ncbi:MAG: peptidase dimerization domain-containing protein [SAR324 cluster bacterium]|nr:peptidase dimerization domain-containing protein [SAR324 cluster bacterium]MBL7034244.1 peptidase dimerization domain-containing protein [SAR324 cluster bacterium]
MSTLNEKISALSAKYQPLAEELLKETIRIPADFVDKPTDQGGDTECGLSNHEGPRLQYLKKRIVEIDAVRAPEDVWFDEYGNLVWTAKDLNDGIADEDKRIIYFDGHSDTVRALRDQWLQKTNGSVDAYDGVLKPDDIARDFLRDELGYLPPDDEWQHLIFGRGSADQLAGVISQIISTKIMLELADEGALKGAIIRSYATTAEEDNDGAGPMYLMNKVLPGAGAELVPDVVILTEGTGDANKGALGIYRGQRGRMQIEVSIIGRACHGSMPWEGLNPLEFGSAIISEAAQRYDTREGFKDDPFLGHGTRTASWAKLDTPSDCAVPASFTFRFDRRLTVGENPDDAVADIDGFESVRNARENGLSVEVSVPTYEELTWNNYRPGNKQIYMGWATPEEHTAIQTAADVYRDVVTPNVESDNDSGATLRKEPRIDRWIFSTDGVGFPIPEENNEIKISEQKDWVHAGGFKHPPMFGIGAGVEQNTHKIGECVDSRELRLAIAFLSRYPSAYSNS